MRRMLAMMLWMVKGVLLLIALAALILWHVSAKRPIAHSFTRYTARPGFGEHLQYWVASDGGWVMAGREWNRYPGKWMPAYLERWAKEMGGRWRHQPSAPPGGWSGRWGPVRWHVEKLEVPGAIMRHEGFGCRLWVVAVVSGTWPVGSMVLALRRRILRRRTAREGLCKHCGYDLRATPDKTGGLLAVCPECGKESRTI